MKKANGFCFVVLLLLSLASLAVAGDAKGKLQKNRIVPFKDDPTYTVKHSANGPIHRISQSPGVSVVGTGGNTLYDFQTNGGDEKRLQVLPDGSVHVVYMGATNFNAGFPTRGTFYAYSSDNGATFTNIGRVEPIRAGFPSLGLTSDGRAVIASHTAPTGLVLGTGVFVDALPGFGIFDSFNAPRAPIECIWPRLGVTTNDRVVFWGSSNTAGDNPQGNSYNTLNPANATFGFAQNQLVTTDIAGEIRGVIATSPGGKVAIALINGFDPPPTNDFGNNNIVVRESTDGGATFGPPVNVTNYPSDTTNVRPGFWLGITGVYINEELHLAWNEVLDQDPTDTGISYFFVDLRIKHWAASVNNGTPTTAARWDSVHFGTVSSQGTNHLQIDYPSLGVDANGVLSLAFTAFSGDDSSNIDAVSGINYADIWAVSSANNGLQWGEPLNLTNSPEDDDRYPYLSPWNDAGKINVLYMSDPVAGSFAFGDAAPTSTPDFLFLKVNHPSTDPYDFYTGVEDRTPSVPAGYSLGQNYPNPFNPSTSIEFTLGNAGPAKLSIYNALGHEVATLVNDKLAAGKHSFTWNAQGAPSGVYFYKLEAANYSQTRKLVLMK